MPERAATVVLVHGAWHGSWCWQRLTPRLQAAGLLVRTLDLPSATSEVPAGLNEDARALNALLGRIAGPVILCGHSYGGMVVSAADTACAQVRQLVYLCAYVTEAGESLQASLRRCGERRPGHWIRRRADGRTQVDAERAAELFYGDCPPDVRTWALGQLRPHWGGCLDEAVAAPAWMRHPSTYIACSEDAVLAPRLQTEIYGARAGRLLTLPGGHCPFLSRPQMLAQLLCGIAGAPQLS